MIKTKEWLINMRKLNNLTQKELANRIGVSTHAIAKIERGERLGSVETWDKINNYFDESHISYECSDVIREIKEDIEEYGNDTVCYLYYSIRQNMIVFHDYALIEDLSNPAFKLQVDELRLKGTLKQALEIFESQNKII